MTDMLKYIESEYIQENQKTIIIFWLKGIFQFLFHHKQDTKTFYDYAPYTKVKSSIYLLNMLEIIIYINSYTEHVRQVNRKYFKTTNHSKWRAAYIKDSYMYVHIV